jgi:hypothetical protein
MERVVMLEEGGPPVFAYVGETKGLRENALYQGETKDLAGFWSWVKVWGVPKWYRCGAPSA